MKFLFLIWCLKKLSKSNAEAQKKELCVFKLHGVKKTFDCDFEETDGTSLFTKLNVWISYVHNFTGVQIRLTLLVTGGGGIHPPQRGTINFA